MDALQLRGHYIVAGELASVYVDVSRKHIMPGVNEIDRLSVMTGDGSSYKLARAKARSIQDYAQNAQREVNKMTAEVGPQEAKCHVDCISHPLTFFCNRDRLLCERSCLIKNVSSRR